jgi:hypothetical protein
VELGGGALLLIGYRARSAAVVIAAFTLATAMFFHRNVADQNQLIHFFKNLIIVGCLLQLVYFGACPLSVDSSAIVIVRRAKRMDSVWELCDAYLNKQLSSQVSFSYAPSRC